MKERIHRYLTAAFAAAIILCGICAAFAAVADSPEGDLPLFAALNDEIPDASPTDASPTDASPTDASPTDATPTDATPTDATPTDADCATVGHRFVYVRQEADPAMGEVVVIVECSVCGEQQRIPLSEYNVPFTDGKTAVAEGDYIIITEGTTAADVLAGCPEGTVLRDAEGAVIPPEAALGSGLTAQFPTSKTYTVLLYGDADGDGMLSPADARIALRISVNLEEHIEWRDKTCHVIVDGKRAVLPADARMILRASVGLEDASLFGRGGNAATPTDATPTDATPTDATPTDATPTDANPGPQPGVYVCAWQGGVYLREAHSFESSALAIIPYREVVTVSKVYIDESDEKMVVWGKITYQNFTGWSVLQYFEPQQAEAGGETDV